MSEYVEAGLMNAHECRKQWFTNWLSTYLVLTLHYPCAQSILIFFQISCTFWQQKTRVMLLVARIIPRRAENSQHFGIYCFVSNSDQLEDKKQ